MLPCNTLQEVAVLDKETFLKPVDLAMFLTSFTRAQAYEDTHFLESLEIFFMAKLDEANSVDIITFLSAMVIWRGDCLSESHKQGTAPKAKLV